MKLKFLLFCIFPITTHASFYWEDIHVCKQKKIIESNEVYSGARNFYKGELVVGDNKHTEILLDTLSSLSVNNEIKAFYFYVFNEILLNSDSSLTEILGIYCQNIIIADVNYVLSYLKKNRKLLAKYCELLGYEFYFKNEGISKAKYDFKEFKNVINKNIKDSNIEISFISEFYYNIKQTINNMD